MDVGRILSIGLAPQPVRAPLRAPFPPIRRIEAVGEEEKSSNKIPTRGNDAVSISFSKDSDQTQVKPASIYNSRGRLA
ncbi:MAG: hypothetical protein GX589_08575 [Deltaproteobacteria bacterium]|nr:hypothetical protein [Deltaproteobacteria bacterium]